MKKPQLSTQPFIYPGRPELHTLPSIRPVMESMVTAAPVAEPFPQPAPTPKPAEPEMPAKEPAANAPEPAPSAEPEPQSEVKEERFEDCWLQMVEELLQKAPLLYFSMKREIPTYHNDTITIEVKTQYQADELEKRRRAMVEYWRAHFQLNIDELEIIVNEEKPSSSAVLSPDDQFKKMKEENPVLLDFLNALNFRMKN